MSKKLSRKTQRFTVIAQDPALRVNGKIVTEEIEVPAELLARGPWGYRIQVIDYDASKKKYYSQPSYSTVPGTSALIDPYAGASNRVLVNDPGFHCQNVYAIAMRILARFEFALGRRVSWGFQGHQLKIAPHAFAEANAFYSGRDEALLFGYFPGSAGNIYTCLSHDIVAHETTHALLDGLRERYTDPSSPDQAGFHEGFADIVAILSVFALPRVVSAAIDLHLNGNGKRESNSRSRLTISRGNVSPEKLRQSALMGLAEEMGQELTQIRGKALRRSAELKPSPKLLDAAEYMEPHRRGEILVAAVLDAFLSVWSERIAGLGEIAPGQLDRERVVQEGAEVADYLLTMAIRAIDYTTPVHLEFCDYLSALITADFELRPDDSKYRFRDHLRKSFLKFGMTPSSTGPSVEAGTWAPPEGDVDHSNNNFESMKHDPDEVYRFIWENRTVLGLTDSVFTRVLSVRPCLRIGPDGFALRETVAECIQIVDLQARELRRFAGISPPKGMPRDTKVRLYGGAALIFDQFGRLKFNIRNRLLNAERQTRRLQYLWEYGYYNQATNQLRHFSHLHRMRSIQTPTLSQERWQ